MKIFGLDDFAEDLAITFRATLGLEAETEAAGAGGAVTVMGTTDLAAGMDLAEGRGLRGACGGRLVLAVVVRLTEGFLGAFLGWDFSGFMQASKAQ